ncbi:nuclear transport factor 2 family protein [Streptomyces sp. NPDC088801]|uniref:nuclear transport factor 2 family protein n=1 Tax=Streptomyces sp. NPDC088801 TaxID=3365903 RepID=UPI0038212BA1
MAQTTAVPADGAIAEQIRHVERARLRALVAGDISTASELHAPDFQLVTPAGHVLSKDAYLQAIASGDINYVEWEPGSIDVRIHGNAAVIRYQATLEVIFKHRPVPRASYWHTDTYENADGQWQAVWSQATAIEQITQRPLP